VVENDIIQFPSRNDDLRGVETTDATIRIYRPGARLGFVIFNPAFEVRIDNATVGSLRPNRVREYKVAGGTHEVQVRTLGYRVGRRKTVAVSLGQTVNLVLPREWAMTLSGQIWLRDASESDQIRIEELVSMEPRQSNIGDGHG